MNDREIIMQLVAKAKEAKRIYYDSVDGTEKVAADFTSMSDAQILKFLKDSGMNVRKAALDGIEQYWQTLSQMIIDNVTDGTPDHYTAQPGWDGKFGLPDERMEESKKYSSFKSQQIITENFRRYINEAINEAGYYGLGAEPFGAEDQLGTKPNTLELTPEKITAALGLEGEKAKGYTSFLKRIIAQENKERYIQYVKTRMPKGDRMAPREWNEGWKQALSDVEEWSKSGKKQSLMNWLIDQQDPYSHYEDEDDREYADFQDDDDYTRSESQQTITENFRRFIKEDDWKDGNTDRAGKYLDTSYEHSLGGLDYDDFIIKPEILAQYMMNRKEKANFAAKIAEIAKDKLGLGEETRNSEGPKVFTWPKKHKEATLKALKALSRKLDGDKYAIAVRTIANL